MAKPNGKCVVCDTSPTVKAHLFPRALMLDMREGSGHLVGGNRHCDGVRFQQNGEWDDRFLCQLHEKQIGSGDDYAVRFCRLHFPAGVPSHGGKAIDVSNPKPNKLLHFAYAVVWRHVVCSSGRTMGLRLGAYEPRIRQPLLSNGPYDLELLVGANPITLKGHASLRMAVAPYRERMDAFNIWHFTISGLDFYLKTDARPFPDTWRPFLANGNNPIVLGRTEDRDISRVPKLFPILQRMRK